MDVPSPIRAVPRYACTRCGDDACVIDGEVLFCGPCFLSEALRRRRQAAPLRFRRRSRPIPGEARLEVHAAN